MGDGGQQAVESSMKAFYSIDGTVVCDQRYEVADSLVLDTLSQVLDAIAHQIREIVPSHQSAVSYIPDGDFSRASHATSRWSHSTPTVGLAGDPLNDRCARH